MPGYLVEFDFPDGMEYFSLAETSKTYNSKQYLNYIDSISGLNEIMGEGKNYEQSDITIIMNDAFTNINGRMKVGYFRNLLDSQTNRLIEGIDINVRDIAGNLLRNMKVDNWTPLPENKFEFVCTSKLPKDDFTEKINLTTWPNAHADAIGKTVPSAYNTVSRIKAWKVDARTNYGDWLLGNAEISTVTRVEVGGHVIDSAYWTLNNDGTYWWLDMGHGVIMNYGDYALVDVTTPAYTPVEIIEDILETYYGVTTIASNAAFKSFLSSQGYSSSNTRYLINPDDKKTAKGLLKEFCDSFECNYIFDENNHIEFVYYDRSNLSIEAEFSEDELIDFKYNRPGYDPVKIKNRARYYYNRNYQNNQWSYGEYNDTASQGDWGVHLEDNIFFPFLAESVQAGVTIEERIEFKKDIQGDVNISFVYDKAKDLKPGHLIRITHREALRSKSPVLYRLQSKSYGNNLVSITFNAKDVDFLSKIYYFVNEKGEFLIDEKGQKFIGVI